MRKPLVLALAATLVALVSLGIIGAKQFKVFVPNYFSLGDWENSTPFA